MVLCDTLFSADVLLLWSLKQHPCEHPGTGTFAECDVIIGRCRPRSGPSAATWRPLLHFKQRQARAQGTILSARSLLFLCTHCRQKLSLSAEKNHLRESFTDPPQGASAFFILFVPVSHFVSEESVSQIKDPELSHRGSRTALWWLRWKKNP